MRRSLTLGTVTPEAFGNEFFGISPQDRDDWLDLVLGLEAVTDDGPDLPRGCVPYIPCPVDAIVRALDYAEVQASDVVVDVGSGLGRAALFVHLLRGSSVVGIEIQETLVQASRELASRLRRSRVSFVHGDAALAPPALSSGSVFFLYCPFSGERLRRLLDQLESLARERPISICCVDLPLPTLRWLSRVSPANQDVEVYRTPL